MRVTPCVPDKIPASRKPPFPPLQNEMVALTCTASQAPTFQISKLSLDTLLSGHHMGEKGDPSSLKGSSHFPFQGLEDETWKTRVELSHGTWTPEK